MHVRAKAANNSQSIPKCRLQTPSGQAVVTLVLRQASVPFHNIRWFSLSATDSDRLFRADGQPMIACLCVHPNIALIQRG
jgi:hypothetical protein